MAPAPRKRARRSVTPEGAPPPAADAPAGTASHLVSFLASYADRERAGDDSDGEGSGSGSGSEGEYRDDDNDDDDDDELDDDLNTRTPGRRGLVGTPGQRKRKTTPAATPRRRAGTTTPRSGARRGGVPLTPLGMVAEDEGFLRMSRADSYFLSAARAGRTSGSSYTALARPLSQAQYEAVVGGARGGHGTADADADAGATARRVQAAVDDAAVHFPQWEAELDAGFNLLIYGYGSKRRMVNRFLRERLAKRGHCAVVNGLFPQLAVRDALAAVEESLGIDEPDCAPPGATPLERTAYRLYGHFSRGAEATPLFLVLHNIDAPALRTPRALAALALLASAPHIHLVATFDHIHTPLLFSATLSNTPPHPPAPKARRRDSAHAPLIPASRGFNWVYHAAPTFDDYDVELAYARLSAASLALGNASSTGVTEEGALQILRSVPPMAARLLKLVLTRQLAALPPDMMTAPQPGSGGGGGGGTTAPPNALDVDLVQRTARDKFIAREEDRFNALLGEFRDHGLVVVADLDSDGRSGRWCWVPLGRAAIGRVLEEMKEVEV